MVLKTEPAKEAINSPFFNSGHVVDVKCSFQAIICYRHKALNAF